MGWILRVEREETETLRLLPGAVKTVGRGPRADFMLDEPLLSRVHCRLSATADRLVVEDLKSTNGTFVNDERVDRRALHDGDRLRLGRLQLVVGRG